MATSFVIQKLKTFGVSDQIACSLASKLYLSSLMAGDSIWPGGNSPIAWRLVVEGIVAAIFPTEKEGCEVQHIYGPDAWFGEGQIINPSSSYIEYVCVTDVELLSMPASVFWQLLNTELCFARYVARLASWRAQRNAEKLVLVKVGSPALRTVMGLGMLFEALASQSSFPATENMEPTLILPVKQHILAQLCGVSRTTLWENMSKLENEGWLKIHYSRLELRNFQAWRAVMHNRRISRSVKMNPTIEDILSDFRRVEMESPRLSISPFATASYST